MFTLLLRQSYQRKGEINLSSYLFRVLNKCLTFSLFQIMFRNTFQSGFLSILFSVGTKPLQIWDKKIHANCRIRRIYFCDRLYSDEELPAEFKLYLPVQSNRNG
ncbi:hypothetical protein P879_01446 [Paragonimus westermani]|uniref:CFA20 domain-containing protein n=1 Tax=Paragonimus westermani TaxID=34504 RepID=A0A8T0DSC4_9TREM|nr:hypothetical protein P879_01446 [Paragonimus westermani]